ncbi:hypothetical protein IFM89_005294 [Coptis chinensis]|uniref:HVA22-like protein n=1 Tax=Coptis chinensis TaxID=261450 RepID=A0A835IW68_9MAGN|nr:hypothetical protein IFM89_005294 [Coptis chinensis]
MGFVQLFMCVATSFHGVAWPLITLIYPLYASVRAIESNSHAENKKWLTYWVLYGLIMVFEFTYAVLIEWLPLWPVIKLMVTCWLVVPSSDGAVHAYNHFVRPCFSVNTHAFGDWLKTQKDKFGVGKSNDFLLHVQLYVQENGFEALEKVIFSKVTRTLSRISLFFEGILLFSTGRQGT